MVRPCSSATTWFEAVGVVALVRLLSGFRAFVFSILSRSLIIFCRGFAESDPTACD